MEKNSQPYQNCEYHMARYKKIDRKCCHNQVDRILICNGDMQMTLHSQIPHLCSAVCKPCVLLGVAIGYCYPILSGWHLARRRSQTETSNMRLPLRNEDLCIALGAPSDMAVQLLRYSRDRDSSDRGMDLVLRPRI